MRRAQRTKMRRMRRRKRRRGSILLLKNVSSIFFVLFQILHPVRRESTSKEALRRGAENGVEGKEVEEIYRKICENLRHNLESIKAYKKVNISRFSSSSSEHKTECPLDQFESIIEPRIQTNKPMKG